MRKSVLSSFGGLRGFHIIVVAMADEQCHIIVQSILLLFRRDLRSLHHTRPSDFLFGFFVDTYYFL